VLTPNPFYRAIKGAPFPDGFDFSNPDLRATFMEYRKALTPDAVARDAVAWLGFVDAQPVVDTKVKAGVSGYCMGGSMTMQAAAALPERIGAAASFHGGALVTDSSDSPHLLAPKIKAISYFGVARNDDEREPEVKDKLKAAYAAAGAPMKLEVYPADHGWCMDDMPPYDAAQAEIAWTKLLGLFKKALV
jgi:carboxymethylenebutenolidase